MTHGVMTKGKYSCHTGGVSLTGLVKARMRKSRRTANGTNLAGLTPGHQMDYLMILSDLRDGSAVYRELLSSPACAVCVYHVLFVCLVWCESTVTQ